MKIGMEERMVQIGTVTGQQLNARVNNDQTNTKLYGFMELEKRSPKC